MNLKTSSKRLAPSFFLAFIPLLLLPSFAPTLRLNFFAPYLVLAAYRRPYLSLLWQALLTGLILDLFSSHPLFGIYALNYCLTITLIRPGTRLFFEDLPLTLPLMSACFSCISTVTLAILFSIFGIPLFVNIKWIMTDCILMSLLDAAYAFVGFSIPFQISAKLSKLFNYASNRSSSRRTDPAVHPRKTL